MKLLRLLGFGALLLAPLALSCAQSPSPSGTPGTVLWQIGRFDHSSHEFRANPDLRQPGAAPHYVVGNSIAAKDWPAMQPGSANPAFGQRPHPFTITFDLPRIQPGAYHLTIGAIISAPRIPRLELNLNGHRGDFYFHREASYYPGNPGLDSPIYGESRLEIDLPSGDLRTGSNSLVLTALDRAADGPGNSAIDYDALRLSHASTSAEPVRATLRPTIFFVHDQGRLEEQVDLTVTLNHPVRHGDAAVHMGGATIRQPLSGQPDFGQQRFRLALPAWTGDRTATVTLELDGDRRTFTSSLQAARRWTMYVVPHAHLDIGYTDFQAKVGEVHDRNIDKLLREMRKHPAMRFSLDGSWIAQQYT